MPASSDTGMKAPDRPPTLLDAMTPPFFTASLSMASAAVVPGPPHWPTPMASRISATESPSAGVGASDKSKMPCCTPEAARGLPGHELAGAGDLEGGGLDGLGHGGDIGLLGQVGEHRAYHAGARHAHVHYFVGLAGAVEGAGHEGVVLHGVAEHDELAGADALPIGGELGGALDDAGHLEARRPC